MERRTQSRRGTAQALSWVVPLVKVAISIFLVLILTPGLPIDPSSSEQLWAGAELVAAVTTLWSHIDNVISAFDDIKIMLDDHHAVSSINKCLKNLQKLVDIVRVQTCRRFVKDIQRPTGRST